MDLEVVWYESVPYLYTLGGLIALFYSPGSGLLKASGVLLILAGASIVRLRWVHRRALDRRAETPATLAEREVV